ncbi:peptidoglycan DD-metalloendopeptidase family protein [Sulfurimonas sp. SAG-AH-194-I05]|nr:peptidoglycan DD-metalloendopeptidase family protein [Sulfurimonas sp. SAG-AH-194-I05]MDF1874292.1 peptidoglycan DD-metalloendopeptidase family protein [Sulfurimonas sp. SAG-AH-194-I05]
MTRLFILLLFTLSLFGAEVENFRWENGVTYSDFLSNNLLPRKHLLDNLDVDDKRLVEEIRAGVHCNILRSRDGTIEQVLIPLNDELQIHIYAFEDTYKFEAIPIIVETKTSAFTLKIKTNPSIDIQNETDSFKLVAIFLTSFGTSIDFTALRKNDDLVMIYEQKYRLGKPFSMPTLKAGMVETNNRPHYIYLNKDGRYYDEKGKQIESFLLARPIQGGRISSRFTKRRFHPVLKKWKAHLGIDYAARRGTPVVAAGSGTLIYVARMGSYGKLIKIRHKDGYETRYAHLKGFRRGMKRGKRVKKGQTIGYVGTTGRSTGPHLHFELRKSGRAINPAKRVQLTTKKLKNKERKSFLKLSKNYNEIINTHLENETKFLKKQVQTSRCYFNNDNANKTPSQKNTNG